MEGRLSKRVTSSHNALIGPAGSFTALRQIANVMPVPYSGDRATVTIPRARHRLRLRVSSGSDSPLSAGDPMRTRQMALTPAHVAQVHRAGRSRPRPDLDLSGLRCPCAGSARLASWRAGHLALRL